MHRQRVETTPETPPFVATARLAEKKRRTGCRSSAAPVDVPVKGALAGSTTRIEPSLATEPMESVAQAVVQAAPISKQRVWIGRGISAVVVAFMLFDGLAKVVTDSHVVKAMGELGWPEGQTVGLGLLVLACTLVYVIPRTSVLGGIVLTAFLGGATAAKLRVEDPTLLFPVVVGALVWLGLFLRDEHLRALVPLRRR
jgi:DoxX-like family